jgi:hypothetical protein
MPSNCPHCSAPAASDSSFCTNCGKAMPAAAPAGPRIVGEHEFASSAAGESLMIDELAKQTRRAYTALMAVAIIQVVFTVILTGLAFSASTQAAMITGVILGGIGALFFGLAFWARKSPLPAAIVGLVIYISLWALDAAQTIAAGHPELISRGIIFKLIIVGCLARAISAGVKYRAILREQASRPGAQNDRFAQAA